MSNPDEIKDIVVALMENIIVNPFQGSIAIEKIISILKYKHNDLYNSYIGSKSIYKKFIHFLESYPEYFTIILTTDNIRLRLTKNENWEYGDYIEEKTKRDNDYNLEQNLIIYLSTYGSDDITNIMCHINTTIKRGDLVRFIKRRSNIFNFNNNSFVVSLQKDFDSSNEYSSEETLTDSIVQTQYYPSMVENDSQFMGYSYGDNGVEYANKYTKCYSPNYYSHNYNNNEELYYSEETVTDSIIQTQYYPSIVENNSQLIGYSYGGNGVEYTKCYSPNYYPHNYDDDEELYYS